MRTILGLVIALAVGSLLYILTPDRSAAATATAGSGSLAPACVDVNHSVE